MPAGSSTSGWARVLRQTLGDLAGLAALSVAFFTAVLIVSVVVTPPFGPPPAALPRWLESIVLFVGVALGPEAILAWLLHRLGGPGRGGEVLARWAEGILAAAGAMGVTALGLTLAFASLDVDRYNPWDPLELAAASWAVVVPTVLVVAWAARLRHHRALWCSSGGLAVLGMVLVVWAALRPGMAVGGEAVVVGLASMACAVVVGTTAGYQGRRHGAS